MSLFFHYRLLQGVLQISLLLAALEIYILLFSE